MSDVTELIGVVVMKATISYQTGSVVSRTVVDKNIGTVMRVPQKA